MEKEVNKTPPLTIGEKLMLARKEKNLSFQQVASYTKLHEDVVKALEENDFQHIGASVYVKGYLRIYVQFLELDTASILNEFDKVVDMPETKMNPNVGFSNKPVGMPSYYKKRSKIVASFWIVVFLLGSTLIYLKWVDPKVKDYLSEEEHTETAASIPLNISGNETAVDDNAYEGAETNTLETTTLVPFELDVDSESDNTENDTSNLLDETQSVIQATENALNTEVTEALTEAPVDEVTQVTLAFSAENWVYIDNAAGEKLITRIFRAGETYEVDADQLPLSIKTANPESISVKTNTNESLSLINSGERRVFHVQLGN